ncbi:MAG: hypothetical protein ABIG98_09240 [Chloroflexota bacterium]
MKGFNLTPCPPLLDKERGMRVDAEGLWGIARGPERVMMAEVEAY